MSISEREKKREKILTFFSAGLLVKKSKTWKGEYFLKFLLAFIAQWTQFLHFTEFWMMEVVHEEASGEETR